MKNIQYEIIIIGGSIAGLSAGMALGRSLRNVLILDSGRPCNRQTPHSHNFITQDGETPLAITAKAKAQVLRYPTVTFEQGSVLKAWKKDDVFGIETDGGIHYSAQKLLLATGIKDLMPEIPGFAECWGISALHCPYCHGYEVKNAKIGLMGNGDTGFELVKLLSNWSKELVLFTNGPSALTVAQQEKLKLHEVPVVETKISGIVHQQGLMQHLLGTDGRQYAVTALFSRLPFVLHTNLSEQLGCSHTAEGYIQIDGFGKTIVDGVFAAGDNSTMLRSIAAATAHGQIAAAMINRELTEKSF